MTMRQYEARGIEPQRVGDDGAHREHDMAGRSVRFFGESDKPPLGVEMSDDHRFPLAPAKPRSEQARGGPGGPDERGRRTTPAGVVPRSMLPSATTMVLSARQMRP